MKQNFQIDFIGVGAAKSGTSWIAQCLREHPQIQFSYTKELAFFNRQNGIYDKNHQWNYLKGLRWYQKQFPQKQNNKLMGEFCVNYLYDQQTPFLIKKHFPDVKIIICLRNPVEMTYSHYWWYKDNFKLEKAPGFEQALSSQPQYLDRAKYYPQLKRYFKLFPAENIHIILYEQIKTEPAQVLKNLCSFLNIDNNFNFPSLNKKVNAARKAKLKSLTKIFVLTDWLRQNGFEFIFTFFKKIKIYQILQTAYTKFNSVNYQYPEIPTKTKKQLKKYFKNDIEKTEKLTGLCLANWK